MPDLQQPLSGAPGTGAATSSAAARVGVAYGIAAYGFWGLAPIYFKAVALVPALEVLAHRIVWSVVLLVAFVVITRRGPGVRDALRSGQTRLLLAATTLLVATNWFVFIWSVAHNLLLQASLGYFINPLVNILLGVIFLRERLSKWGMVSVVLAALGVSFQIAQGAGIPYIALILAFSFGFYGLLRKIVRVDAVIGLTVETSLLFPLAAAYIIALGFSGGGHFTTISRPFDGLLLLAGVVTTLPLVWFAKAARRLRLATIGFIQYLAPSLHFLLAVFAYGEPFSWHAAVTFGCIWTALIIYSIDAARNMNAQ
ncbi:EamA family transporter RarD [Candidatus Zixiibacteriota bacterium]